jgi:small subunit ribosomal protein S16
MLRIRFLRKGRKKQPFYKIVVTDKNNPPASGRFVEDVGFYDPLTKDCNINGERVIYWMEKGAQPSDVVRNLLIKKEIIKGEKINVVSLTTKRAEKITAKKESEKPLEAEVKEDVVKEETVEPEIKEEVKEDVVKEKVVEPQVKEEDKEEESPAKEEKKKEKSTE